MVVYVLINLLIFDIYVSLLMLLYLVYIYVASLHHLLLVHSYVLPLLLIAYEVLYHLYSYELSALCVPSLYYIIIYGIYNMVYEDIGIDIDKNAMIVCIV